MFKSYHAIVIFVLIALSGFSAPSLAGDGNEKNNHCESGHDLISGNVSGVEFYPPDAMDCSDGEKRIPCMNNEKTAILHIQTKTINDKAEATDIAAYTIPVHTREFNRTHFTQLSKNKSDILFCGLSVQKFDFLAPNAQSSIPKFEIEKILEIFPHIAAENKKVTIQDNCQPATDENGIEYELLTGKVLRAVPFYFAGDCFGKDCPKEYNGYVDARLISLQGENFTVQTKTESSKIFEAKDFYFEEGKTYQVCGRLVVPAEGAYSSEAVYKIDHNESIQLIDEFKKLLRPHYPKK